jgi:phosphoribosylformylglycinamidine cyclo-ligase
MTARKKKSAYAEAGVDIDVMMKALSRAKKKVHDTYTPSVLSDLGTFGGLYRNPGSDAILVSSIDGVGTKLKVAVMAQRHHTVGRDLVNHCVNDILVQGARPLFFMDYIGAAELDARVFEAVVSGLCKGCGENGCALLGGETAEMPGLYPAGEYDLVGTIVGAVERKRLVTGRRIKSSNVVIGLASSGLHTNGYSLARRIIFEQAGLDVHDTFPGMKKTVADILLAVHRSYLKPVQALLRDIRVNGMAHITGGGLVDNVPRIMPQGLCAVIDRSTWETPLLFRFLEEQGQVHHEEMYRVFNMGIGFVLMVKQKDAEQALQILQKQGAHPVLIGRVEKGDPAVCLVN